MSHLGELDTPVALIDVQRPAYQTVMPDGQVQAWHRFCGWS